MNAPVRKPLVAEEEVRTDPVEVFRLRCHSRAKLWHDGEIDLHSAVDELQHAAEASGLIDAIGQDAAQGLMAAVFAALRDDLLKFEDIEAEPTFADDAWSAPGWRDAAVDYHKDRGDRVSIGPYTADELARLRELMADDVTLERAWQEINHPTDRAAASTLEALTVALRERGTAALAEGSVRHRLAQLNEEQVVKVGDRLQAGLPRVAKAWSADEVRQLLEAWGGLRGG